MEPEKINKEVAKARKRFGESFDETMFLQTNGRVAETAAKRNALHERFAEAMNAGNLEELRQIINQGVVEGVNVARGFPYGGVHEDGGVDAHDVLVQQSHGLPPIAFYVVFEFYAVLAVVVHGRKAVVYFRALKHKTVFLGMGNDFLEHVVLLCHYFVFG